MTTICKCTITRPNLDSLFVFEYNSSELIITTLNSELKRNLHASTHIRESNLTPTFPKVILHRYEEFITWAELIERKDELRPDLKYMLSQQGLLDITTILDTYGEGPPFNPFSLTHTRSAEYETFEDWVLNYNWVFEQNTIAKIALETTVNTVDEELYIDGVLTEYNGFKQLY